RAATSALYALSLHDALPIYADCRRQTPGGVAHHVADCAIQGQNTSGKFAVKFTAAVFYLHVEGTQPVAPVRHAGRADRVSKQDGDRKSTRLNSSHLVISYAV